MKTLTSTSIPQTTTIQTMIQTTNTDETENGYENISVIRAAQAKKLKTVYAVDNEETWTVSLFSPPELSNYCITVYGK